MKRLIKWLFAGLVVIFCCLAFAALISSVVFYNTLPASNQEIRLAGLENSAEVVFDKHGVPHIEAKSMPEAMQVLGYVHARDRMWQMEFLRRVGEGRLSEFLGRPTLETDVFLRTLGMAESARKSYERLLPDTKAALEAYSRGVNAFINRPTSMFETSLGAEFLILGHTPEPWEPWNSALILKVMGLTLGNNMDEELQRLAFAAQGFSSREIDEIMPYSPRDNPPELPDLRALYGFGVDGKNTISGVGAGGDSDFAQTEDKFEWPTGRSASNNWVVSGSVTASGKPVLANDPHLGLTAPSSFYLAHVSWPDEDRTRHVIGGTLPGVPFVIAGRNTRVAWGLTTTNLDSQDVFLEQLKDDDEKSYRTEFGWFQFVETQEEIGISGEDPFVMQRRVSRHGPVLPDGFRNLKKNLPDGTVAALRWTGLAEDDTSLDTLYFNGVADSVEDVLKGMDRAVSPMQSVVVADVDGAIALATPGRLPIRNKVNRVAGRAPVPGWIYRYQWQNQLRSELVPKFTNPTEGAFTTANANFFPADYPHHITYDWAEQFRQERAEELVFELPDEHTVETSKRIMADDFSAGMRKMVQLAVRQARTGAGRSGDIVQALARWDGRMRGDRPVPLIALALFRHLHKNIFEDDLEENYDLIKRGRVTRVINVLEGGTLRNWCNDIETPASESCGDMVSKSLEDALDELEGLQGEDWNSWRYGEAHTAYSEHRPFGSVGALAGFFNIELPSSGGPYTLHRGQTDFGKPGPYRSRHAGAYRAIYDLANLDQSLYVISTGQSGNFLSPRYSDLAPLWANSEFITMSTNKEEYSQEKAGTWVFDPQ